MRSAFLLVCSYVVLFATGCAAHRPAMATFGSGPRGDFRLSARVSAGRLLAGKLSSGGDADYKSFPPRSFAGLHHGYCTLLATAQALQTCPIIRGW